MATRLDPDQDVLTDLREREPTAAEALITVTAVELFGCASTA